MNHVIIVTKALLLIEAVSLGQVDYLCSPGQALNIFTPTHDSMINTSSHSSHYAPILSLRLDKCNIETLVKAFIKSKSLSLLKGFDTKIYASYIL